ncbi:MAG: hypothetical protein PWP54_1614 [Thermosipho sp. (in: thermotogales)]|nr:hypothetical protein [Thermosipho sp. (in: thermotogales)]
MEVKEENIPNFIKEKLEKNIDYYVLKNFYKNSYIKSLYFKVNNVVFVAIISEPLSKYNLIFDSFKNIKESEYLERFGVYSSNFELIYGFNGPDVFKDDSYIKKLNDNSYIENSESNYLVYIYKKLIFEDENERFGPIFITITFDFFNLYFQVYLRNILTLLVGLVLVFLIWIFSNRLAKPYVKLSKEFIKNLKIFSSNYIPMDINGTTIEIDELRNVIEVYNNMAKKVSEEINKEKILTEKLNKNIIELEKLNKELEEAYIHFATKLSEIAEIYDEQTGNHIKRVGMMAEFITIKLGQPRDFVKQIKFFAPLHDIGKIKVPREILLKNGPLTDEEWEIVKNHTIYGAEIIGEKPFLKMARNIALFHHENYDGSGYPFGLKGNNIPLEAAITKICDVYDALRTKRSYKNEYSHEESIRILKEGDNRTKPSHFNPKVLKVFLENEKSIKMLWEMVNKGGFIDHS